MSGLVRVRMMSSAYKATLCSWEWICTPEISALFRICAASGSMHKANSRGESRHPCLVPLLIGNRSEGNPWWTTLAAGAAYNALTACWKMPPNPNAPSVDSKYGQSILSKAFSASRLKAILRISLAPIKSIISTILLVLSAACLFLMKPT
ncbi:hypothetical protein FKM82_026479 [Ascaphus truei]